MSLLFSTSPYCLDIIVSFSGTANVSGSSVYAQKVYDYAETNVGYTFANVLTVQNGQMVVDAELLNDVKEQIGGGGELLRVSEDRNMVADAATMMVDGAKAVVDTTKEATEGAVGTAKVAFDVVAETVTKTGGAIRSEAQGWTA